MKEQTLLDIYRDPNFPPKIIYNTYSNTDCHSLLLGKQAMAAFESPGCDGVIWWSDRDRSSGLDSYVEVDVFDKNRQPVGLLDFSEEEVDEIVGQFTDEDVERVVFRVMKMVATAKKLREAA